MIFYFLDDFTQNVFVVGGHFTWGPIITRKGSGKLQGSANLFIHVPIFQSR